MSTCINQTVTNIDKINSNIIRFIVEDQHLGGKTND